MDHTPKNMYPALIRLDGCLNKINEDTKLGGFRMENGSGGAGEGELINCSELESSELHKSEASHGILLQSM